MRHCHRYIRQYERLSRRRLYILFKISFKFAIGINAVSMIRSVMWSIFAFVDVQARMTVTKITVGIGTNAATIIVYSVRMIITAVRTCWTFVRIVVSYSITSVSFLAGRGIDADGIITSGSYSNRDYTCILITRVSSELYTCISDNAVFTLSFQVARWRTHSFIYVNTAYLLISTQLTPSPVVIKRLWLLSRFVIHSSMSSHWYSSPSYP